ncbi:uncharacterized protein JN550_013763 [Neoarthrinium moseri]|uniref:uncharacterized protein n=1 Tax=Neoarthrinium moseri TaxID=1658444 RepID=UPI001FDC58E9|nr:uncharacterized protein JN550_013763 [Neoarthrinium moseri]KAI1856522.1 hypothetical protein JN550_013763 [Neoarthrinium moseri]
MNGGADPNISNGTCYSTENTETKGDFIACGNAALGHWPCCHMGDYCLSFDNANACWDPDSGNTYIAGCTDSGFNSRACPWKSTLFNTQEWVAIQQCDKDRDDDITEWGGCKAPANSTELEKLPHQSCDPYCSSPVFKGESALPAFALLPNRTGASISWTSGFNPMSVYAPITTTADISGTKTTITSIKTHTPTPTSSSSQPTPTSAMPTTGDTTSNTLSTGAKAGIGVGAAGAVLMIIAVILLGLLVRRRKRKEKEEKHSPTEQSEHSAAGPYRPSPKPWAYVPETNTYSGFKSELPADVMQGPTVSGYKSELPVNESPASMRHLSPYNSPHPSTTSPQSPYATYNSTGDQLSSVSESTTVHPSNYNYLSPQNSGEHSQQELQAGKSPRAIMAISELHG